MNYTVAILLSFFCMGSLFASETPVQEKDFTQTLIRKTMKIKLTFQGGEAMIQLEENPTSLDFLALLPVTLKMKDHGKTEKIAYLPRALSHKDAPVGFEPKAGDVTLYAPWGNIAIFYRKFNFSQGLIPLGHVISGLDVLSKIAEDTEITMEVVDSL